MQSLDTDTERMAAAAMASAEEFEAEEEMIVEDDEMALLNEGERSSRRRDPSYGGLRKSELVSTWRQVKEIVIEVSISSAAILSGTEQSTLQTVPTLLLTTVGLLFTGELLDHVSVYTHFSLLCIAYAHGDDLALESDEANRRAYHNYTSHPKSQGKLGNESLFATRDGCKLRSIVCVRTY